MRNRIWWLAVVCDFRSLRWREVSRLGRHREAISAINEGLEKDSSEDKFYLLRGNEYMFLKEFQRAIDDYTRSIGNAPEFAGRAFEARGKA